MGLLLAFFYVVAACVILVFIAAMIYLPWVALRQTIWESVRARQMRQLRRTRPGETVEHFLRFFTGQEVPERIARTIHSFLAYNVAKIPDFPVRPADSLAEIYGIGRPGGMPMADALHDMASRCGLQVEADSLEKLPATVHDLVILMTALYRERERNRAAGTLLRPSDAPTETLLRPAQGPGETDAQQLLRPAGMENEDGARE
jgi:hypothetical protein